MEAAAGRSDRRHHRLRIKFLGAAPAHRQAVHQVVGRRFVEEIDEPGLGVIWARRTMIFAPGAMPPDCSTSSDVSPDPASALRSPPPSTCLREPVRIDRQPDQVPVGERVRRNEVRQRRDAERPPVPSTARCVSGLMRTGWPRLRPVTAGHTRRQAPRGVSARRAAREASARTCIGGSALRCWGRPSPPAGPAAAAESSANARPMELFVAVLKLCTSTANAWLASTVPVAFISKIRVDVRHRDAELNSTA